MGLGEIYENVMRPPGRRRRSRPMASDLTPRRRMVNAVIVPVATLIAGRGVIDMVLNDAGTTVRYGIVAVALTAWLTARWHLSLAGRARMPATVLGVALLVSIGSAFALHHEGIVLEPVQVIGLHRGAFAGMAVAAMAAVAVSMLGMRPRHRTERNSEGE
jgi:lysylphosphatidylglycerol synthetase-like protein (DUF2156 family)